MKKLRIGFIGIFIIVLFVFFAKTATSHKEISNVEKRVLANYPKFELKRLADETYYTELTEAYSDQLFGRGHLVKGYYLMQFQRYLGSVVEGKDGEMFSSIQTAPNYSDYEIELQGAAGGLNELAEELKENDTKLVFLSIPRKDAYLVDYLPKTYTSSREIYEFGMDVLEDSLSDDIIVIDALKVFDDNKSDNNYYFKTDHHINVRGGQLLYKEVMNVISEDRKVNIYELEDIYDIHSTTVNGSFNKQVGQSVKLSNEELYLSLKEDIPYVRYENDVESNLAIWGKGHDYGAAFMTGDRAYTRVETNRKDLPNVMYVGSSFTNVLEALTIPSVNRMVSIDYRDNKSGISIVEYAKKYDIDYVVFVPAQSNNSLNPDKILLHLGK